MRKALEIEPANKQVKAELEKLRLQLRPSAEEKATIERREADKRAFGDNMKAAFTTKAEDKSTPVKAIHLEPGEILPIKKRPHERSTKPLRRIQIVETGDTDMVELAPSTITSADPQDRLPTAEGPDLVEFPNPTKPNPTSPPLQLNVEKEISDGLKATVSDDDPLPDKPTTSVQFVSVWSRMNSKARAEYLRRLDADDYADLFKLSLESDTLSEMLSVIAGSGWEGGDKVRHLAGMAKVPRMSSLAMFMSEEDIAAVEKVLGEVRDCGNDARIMRDTNIVERVFSL